MVSKSGSTKRSNICGEIIEQIEEHTERRKDRDVAVVQRADGLSQAPGQRERLGARLEHLPVGGDVPGGAVVNHVVACVHGKNIGAELETDRAELVLRKGFHREIDSYSAFRENDKQTATGLAGYLRDALEAEKEERRKRLAEEELKIPYLRIETDYSPSDSARIAVRAAISRAAVKHR